MLVNMRNIEKLLQKSRNENSGLEEELVSKWLQVLRWRALVTTNLNYLYMRSLGS